MQVDINIQNADESIVNAIKEILKTQPKVTYKIEEKTENGFTPKFEAEVLQDFKEITQSIKNRTLKTFKTFEEYQKAMNAL